MNGMVDLPSLLRRKMLALVIGVIALLLCGIGWMTMPGEFFIAYLFSEFFFLGLSLGSLAILMIHHLTAGYWGYGLRRFLEAAVGNLPILAVLFVPIFFGLSELYPWRHPDAVATHELLAKKLGYLNTTGFIVRTVIVFTIWIGIASLLLKWSAQQDISVSVEPTRKMRTLSGPGLVIYPVTMTFAAVDWIMSMEGDWYSTMFPVLVCIGQILGALSLMILLLARAANSAPLANLAGADTFHKIGNLLLAFVMMWAYLAFGQLLVVWSGNLPPEISWYLHRIAGGWRWVASFIAFFQFFLPFFLLLMRPVKQKRHVLAMVAGCVFLSYIVTIWWTIAPSIHTTNIYVSWLAFAAFFAIGGLWWAAFLWNLERRRLVPLNDPRFAVAVPA
jgi:hypothetical protein